MGGRVGDIKKIRIQNFRKIDYVKYLLPHKNFFFATHSYLRRNTQKKKNFVVMIYYSAVTAMIYEIHAQGRNNHEMSEVIYKVLQDTRNDINPDTCALCQSPVKPVYASTTNCYHICVYECKQCGHMSFALYEKYETD